MGFAGVVFAKEPMKKAKVLFKFYGNAISEVPNLIGTDRL